MKFDKIKRNSKVFPGEYLLHVPTNEIVICGAYNYEKNFIRCLTNNGVITDKVLNFKKISLSTKERKERRALRCKGCSGR